MGNSQTLENTVLTKTPQEAAALCKQLGENENSCRALALACRYRGLDHVKALVESGATFKYTKSEEMGGYYTVFFWLAPLEMTEAIRRAYFIRRNDACFSNEARLVNAEGEVVKTLSVLPSEERTEIVRYLCENRERVLLDINELLFYSIMSGCETITAVLKQFGAKFTEKRTTTLTEGGRSFEWLEFCSMAECLGDDKYLETMRTLIAETGGKKLHYTDAIYWGSYNREQNKFRWFKPEFFVFLLENFNEKKINKTMLMKGAINENSVECLAMCAEHGWLKMPKKRDEMIAYATKEQKTECIAFLLDFKNRTADLAAEREKAEKKAERELNADPNSASELKKIWSTKKLEDGTLRITNYKGKRSEIEVPAKIGKSTVKEIGAFAFAAGAPRLRIEQRDFRRKELKKVILPDTITVIGEEAFRDCWHLSELNIPDGVVEIGKNAFASCRNMTEFVIPETVTKMNGGTFAGCLALQSVKLPDGLSEIGDYMFSNCQKLQEIRLPASVQSIGIWAFSRCTSLEEIVIPEGVTEIKRQAFMHCENLKTVVIPASVKSMKNYTYRGRAPETVFHDSPNVTAVVEPKSYAEKYCGKNGIAFKHKES